MTNQTEVRLTFPHLDDAAAGEQAQKLLHELRQNAELIPHLDRKKTAVARTNPEALDFGVTLLAVLGTPAVIILAKAIRDWMERTGTKVEANGIVVTNVRSQDAAAIVAASRKGTGADGERPPRKKPDHGPAIKGRTEAKGRTPAAAAPSHPNVAAAPGKQGAKSKPKA
jgi:hypothetical protein